MPTAVARSVAAQSFRLRPFAEGLGAEVEGIAVPAIDDATFPAVYDAFLEHRLLLFRDQDLPPGAQVASNGGSKACARCTTSTSRATAGTARSR